MEPLSRIAALRSLLLAAGVDADAIPAEEQAAATLYQAVLADRRALVVLDNASSAPEVRALLPTSRHAGVLVTSRTMLRGLVARDGARPLEIGPLATGEVVTLLRLREVLRLRPDAPETLLTNSSTLSNIAKIHLRRGEYTLAREHQERGLALAKEAGDPHVQVLALEHLGSIEFAEGNLDVALARAGSSLAGRRPRPAADRVGAADRPHLAGPSRSRGGDPRARGCPRPGVGQRAHEQADVISLLVEAHLAAGRDAEAPSYRMQLERLRAMAPRLQQSP